MHHLRRIRSDELPRVRDDATDEMRPPTEQELLNFGLVPLGDDLYDVAHADGRPEPPWGVRVIQGPRSVRYGQLPPRVRGKVLRARVRRGKGPARREEIIREADVQEGDEVEELGLLPNRWRGERA